MAATGSSMERPPGRIRHRLPDQPRGGSLLPLLLRRRRRRRRLQPPIGPLTEANGAIYGTATSFRPPLSPRRIRRDDRPPVHGTRRLYPNAGLILGSDGDLYGTTHPGGEFHGNRVPHRRGRNLRTAPFLRGRRRQRSRGRADRKSGWRVLRHHVLRRRVELRNGLPHEQHGRGHDAPLFTAALDDGAYPIAPLIHAADGNFFGTTNFGGGAGGWNHLQAGHARRRDHLSPIPESEGLYRRPRAPGQRRRLLRNAGDRARRGRRALPRRCLRNLHDAALLRFRLLGGSVAG